MISVLYARNVVQEKVTESLMVDESRDNSEMNSTQTRKNVYWRDVLFKNAANDASERTN